MQSVEINQLSFIFEKSISYPRPCALALTRNLSREIGHTFITHYSSQLAWNGGPGPSAIQCVNDERICVRYATDSNDFNHLPVMRWPCLSWSLTNASVGLVYGHFYAFNDIEKKCRYSQYVTSFFIEDELRINYLQGWVTGMSIIKPISSFRNIN